MNKRIIDLLKNSNNPSLHLLIVTLIEGGKSLIVQKAINRINKGSVIEDGIIGYQTIKVLLAIDEDTFSKTILNFDNPEFVEKVTKSMTAKDSIMGYLGRYEGTIVHWNKGETAFTTPYGVYGKPFPKAEPIEYIQDLAKKYTGSRLVKRNRKQLALLNVKLTRKEKEKIKDLCWDFYVKNFMDALVIPLLNAKANLSYFSCCVNGGKIRGAKVLQKAVGAKPDGVIGNGTLGKIRLAIKRGVNINNGILNAMLAFYKYLIKKYPRRFKKYKNGWFARIKGLR